MLAPALAAGVPAMVLAQQVCPQILYPDGYGNSGNGACTIPAGTSTNRILADAGTINGNAITDTVLYGNAIQANAGAAINLGKDATLGPSRINEAYGGGGIIGLYTLGAGASITTDGLIADMPGSSTAIKAENGGVIHLNDGTEFNIPGAGGGAHVIWATGAGSQILSDGFVLTADIGGGGNVGVHSANGGYIEMDASTISLTSNGGGETGMLVEDSAEIKALNTMITLDANNAYGAIVRNNSYLYMQGGYFDAYREGGQGTIGVFISGSGTNRVELDDTTIESTYDAFQVDSNATADITLDAAKAVLNGGVVLRTGSGSNTTFEASASQFTGAIVSATGSLSAVTMQNGSDWEVTADSNMSTLTNSASTIHFTYPSGDPTQWGSYKAITTADYVGSGASYLDLNTYLGEDGSPSDRLVLVGGAATGTTYVRVQNTAGPGAETTGNGILVIEAVSGAATAVGAFVQEGEIRAGAFDYTLQRGSVDTSSPQSWYLRSGFSVAVTTPPPEPPPPPPTTGGGSGGSGGGSGGSGGGFGGSESGGGSSGGGSGGSESGGGGGEPPAPPPVEPPTTVTPTPGPGEGAGEEAEEELPVDPPPAVLPPGEYPTVGPEIATYSVVQPTARQLGLLSIGTMHERIGNTVQGSPDPPPDGPFQSAWGRIYGQDVTNHYLAFVDPQSKGEIFGAQVGIDVWHGESGEGQADTAGLYFAYGRANLSVTGLVADPAALAYDRERTGDVQLNGYAFAGYWTHVGPGNWYIDGVLQGTHYTGDASTQYADLSTPGNGFAASIEGGYPFLLAERSGFTLEPQLQFIWQRIAFGQRNDGEGPVDPGNTTGTSGRLGTRAQWTIGRSPDVVWQPYARLDFWHDWGGRSTTDYGVDQVPLLQGASRVELDGGLTASVNSSFAVYGQVGYQKAVGGTDGGGQRRSVAGSLGLRYRW
ncbi:autotransporter outer membrane beta-barrel domain-containing protein [Dyella sp. C9]|uniref:autotransporter family protein n=1 Tax=Dyella sp. C9 TaxID=2202154 RepID=UPI00130041A6|nr:autotransporter outer membrane beta-barrel domain-containing protein [Dyella sp. C9]